AHAQRQHLPVRRGHAAAGGEQAPQEQADDDDGAPAVDVDKTSDKDSKERVKHGKAQTLQVTHLAVINVQVQLKRLHHHAENLAVDKRKHVGDHQHADYVPDVHG